MSWGNAQNAWNDQDMNSSGKKLNVNGNSGGTNFQAEITDTNAAGKALKVTGGVQIEKQAGQTSPVLKVDGGTFLQGQTEPALKVEGTAAHPGQYVAIIKDNDVGAHALRVDGDVHLFGNNTLQGRLVANNLFGSSLSINTGLGSDNPADPDIFIGQAQSSGETPSSRRHPLRVSLVSKRLTNIVYQIINVHKLFRASAILE